MAKMYILGSSVTDHFDPQTSDIDHVVKVALDVPANRGAVLLLLWDEIKRR